MSSEKDFSFHEIHHIPGGLGAGKSTFITMATYYLTKMKKAKVGIIETTVDNVLKRVKELRKFNIKAVPIIGYSTQAAHLENQLKSLQSQIEDLADWDQEDYELLSYLSGRCIIHSLSKDYEDNPNDVYPCQHILENGEPRLCPLYQQCGVHNQTSDLHDAEVWVATSHSALKSRIPKMADPYNRVYFEAMYDLLDVIFIDEADKVQQDFDEAFFTEYDLFGDKRSLYNELERIGQHLSFHHMENNEAYTWKRNLLKLSQLILSIYNLLSHSSSLKTFLSNKIFHTYFLFVNIFKKIDSQENAQFYQELRTYIDEPMKVQKLLSLVDELLRSESFAETDKIMSDFLQKNVKEHCDDDQVKRQIEFLLYLVQIDYYIKYLIQHFSSMKEYLGIEADLGEFLRFHQKDILPFVPETMTGMMIGYRYLQQENKFKYMEYSGIGRQLLYGWNHLYKRLDRLEGPGVIYLSGTSYAPGSAHSHLPVKVKWLLTANRPSPALKQYFTPIMDKAEGMPIFISGVNVQKRINNLQKMVNGLKDTIQQELNYWQKSKRRILIVVNSYEDTEVVAEALKQDLLFQDNFKILVKDKQTTNYHYPKALIEQFAETDESIFVAPLLAIGRGYNILQLNENTSLFGSVFFLIRPYVVPGDMSYMIQILHSLLPKFLQKVDFKGLEYGKAMGELKRLSIAKLEQMIREPDFWGILEENEREILSWFTFIQVWQMVGRLLRGGTDARVFYVDGKFMPEFTKEKADTPKTSMLESWKKILNSHPSDPVVAALYGPFIESINNIERKAIHY